MSDNSHTCRRLDASRTVTTTLSFATLAWWSSFIKRTMSPRLLQCRKVKVLEGMTSAGPSRWHSTPFVQWGRHCAAGTGCRPADFEHLQLCLVPYTVSYSTKKRVLYAYRNFQKRASRQEAMDSAKLGSFQELQKFRLGNTAMCPAPISTAVQQ